MAKDDKKKGASNKKKDEVKDKMGKEIAKELDTVTPEDLDDESVKEDTELRIGILEPDTGVEREAIIHEFEQSKNRVFIEILHPDETVDGHKLIFKENTLDIESYTTMTYDSSIIGGETEKVERKVPKDIKSLPDVYLDKNVYVPMLNLIGNWLSTRILTYKFNADKDTKKYMEEIEEYLDGYLSYKKIEKEGEDYMVATLDKTEVVDAEVVEEKESEDELTEKAEEEVKENVTKEIEAEGNIKSVVDINNKAVSSIFDRALNAVKSYCSKLKSEDAEKINCMIDELEEYRASNRYEDFNVCVTGAISDIAGFLDMKFDKNTLLKYIIKFDEMSYGSKYLVYSNLESSVESGEMKHSDLFETETEFNVCKYRFTMECKTNEKMGKLMTRLEKRRNTIRSISPKCLHNFLETVFC